MNASRITFTYDKLFLTDVRDSKGQRYRFAYDTLGRVIKRYDPADTTSWNRYISYRYNSDGLLTSWTNRQGYRITNTFDRLHRLRSKTGDSTTADYFDFDTVTHRVAVSRNAVSRDSTFFATSMWIDSVATRFATDSTKRFRSKYVNSGNFTLYDMAVTTNTAIQFVARRYDQTIWAGTLDSVKLGLQATKLGINNDGIPVSFQWPSGITRTDSITKIHAPYVQRYTANTPVDSALWRGFGYDSLFRVRDNVWKEDSTKGAQKFAYDSLGQIRSSTITISGLTGCTSDNTNGYACTHWNLPTVYTYDPVGNRIDAADALYSTGNRIARFNGWNFGTDLDGNVIWKVQGTGDTTYFAWSAEGRLDRVRKLGTTLRYEYDALGRLVRKSRNSIVSRHFLWDQDQLLAEIDSTVGKRIGEYAYYPGIDRPLAIITGATVPALTQYFAQDPLGNAIGLVNGNTVKSNTVYGPWGDEPYVRNVYPDTNRLHWKGLVWEGDLANLYYVRSRWYDPSVGRFLTEDPIGLEGGGNMYVFAKNNPINGWDPSGMCEAQNWTSGGKQEGEPYYVPEGGTIEGFGHTFKCCGQGWVEGSSCPERADQEGKSRTKSGRDGMGRPSADQVIACNRATALFRAQAVIDGVTIGLALFGGGALIAGARTASQAYKTYRAGKSVTSMVLGAQELEATGLTALRLSGGFAIGGQFLHPQDVSNFSFRGGLEAVGRVLPGSGTYFAYQDMQAACTGTLPGS